MKAITIRQPWCWAVAIGAKTVENRTRGTLYRGPLAIHAGQGWSDRGRRDWRIARTLVDSRSPIAGPHSAAELINGALRPEQFHLAAVIAIAELVDSHPDTGCCRPWGESNYTEAGGRTRTVIHHLVLEDIQALTPPVPARGALGLWTPADDLLEHLRATS